LILHLIGKKIFLRNNLVCYNNFGKRLAATPVSTPGAIYNFIAEDSHISSQMSLFYPLIIALGIISSYTDIKYKVIRNRHLLWFVALALIIHAYLQINHKITLTPNLLLNFLIGIITAYLFYSFKMWGAGDAKLFIVFSLLMPTQKHNTLIPFPSAILFINIFLLSTAAMIALSIYKIIKNKDNFLSKISLSDLGKRVSSSFLIILGLGWTISYLTKPLSIYFSPIVNIILIYILYSIFYKSLEALRKKIIILAIIGCSGFILRTVLEFNNLNLSVLILSLMKILKYTLVFYFINLLIYHDKDTNKVSITMPFAPFIFLGTLATDTGFVYYAIGFINLILR